MKTPQPIDTVFIVYPGWPRRWTKFLHTTVKFTKSLKIQYQGYSYDSNYKWKTDKYIMWFGNKVWKNHNQ